MARFRKIDPRIWNDEKFRDLSDRGKLVFLFVLTHPHLTALGAMRGTPPGLAAELGWSQEDFAEAFQEVLRKGLAEHDQAAAFIALPNFLRYNQPESPNVVKAWASAVDLLPECALKNALLIRVKAFSKDLPEAFAKALPQAFAKGMANQEQKQEQKQKTAASAACDEQAPPRSPPAAGSEFTFPTSGKDPKEWTLPQAKLDEYIDAYPGLDVRSEMIKARQWARDNPTKRKSAGGMPAFLTRWINKAQDSPTNRTNAAGEGRGHRSSFQMNGNHLDDGTS
ncbi:MAG: hypothetical protein WD894_05000 [Pirellulales bacterium]